MFFNAEVHAVLVRLFGFLVFVLFFTGRGPLSRDSEGVGFCFLFFSSKGGIQSAFCIQNVVQYFGTGHWHV